ncbi:hypothetical protein FRB94_003947 [Tulasnella sp. JGI-2019a]|nr:hypothetical protein FRB94_003947 [Tulasnella sp. JGI-2019a]KAG9008199.1 hypothetical protein FRB93_006767 [Tulasnella sp. JGI-2019a]
MFLPVAVVLSFQPALISASIFRRTSASTSDPSGIGQFFFDQLLDHTNPSSGTFKQRYFFSDKYYVGQGSPVIISSPGEQSADGFDIELSGPTLQNAMMQIFGAAGVILEHRYWGQSSPYSNLTTRNLQYLQVSQAIDDYKYFVENVQLSWKGLNSKPSVTPWVNLGCSYPGLLVAYTQQQYSDLFAAAWASSAPDYRQYFSPIEEGMPKNCSADASAVVAFVDLTLASGSPANVSALKAQFGLEALANDDFARCA